MHDQIIACLFAAGIATHILLVAGLRNPTVRTRYAAVRALLADYGKSEFHEALLDLLGSTRLTREQAGRHITPLAEIFDIAGAAINTPFAFAADVSPCVRPISIDGSLELIARGYHREAMFWIAVMYSRCREILLSDAPELLNRELEASYLELLGDLGLAAHPEIRQRCAEIERTLPRIASLAEEIIAANGAIED